MEACNCTDAARGAPATYLGANGAPADGGRCVWRQTVLAHDHEGHEQAFAIGPDDHIWCYRTDDQGMGAGRLISTGLRADRFAVGRGGDGRLVVVAADRHRLTYVVEQHGAGGARWSAPRMVQCRGLDSAEAVCGLVARKRDGNLFVSFKVRQASAPAYRHSVWEGIWAGDALVFGHAPMIST